MPFGLQPQDLLIILIVALLIFGPSRLPELGRSVGSMMREFRTATKEATQSFSEEVKPAEVKSQEVKPAEVKSQEPPSVACKNCGKPVPAGAKFCTECGAAQ
ncbi:MAG: twin-arginine translocase TatA/TatE family subunit [Chloroflexi bacterium]|nr:twin-arginine translocase TatA/TatE family subunit [Chloroflexota bacterium]